MSRGDKIGLGTFVVNCISLGVSVILLLWSIGWFGNTPSESPSEVGSISVIASWIASISFTVFVAYVNGRFVDTEMYDREHSAHAQHFLMGTAFSLALAIITLSVLTCIFKQNDPRILLFYHSLISTFFLVAPAFIVSIVRHTQRISLERSPEVLRERLAGFRMDAEAHDVLQVQPTINAGMHETGEPATHTEAVGQEIKSNEDDSNS